MFNSTSHTGVTTFDDAAAVVLPTSQQLRCCGGGCKKVLSEATDGVTVSSEPPNGRPYEKRRCRHCKTMNYVTIAR